MSWIRRLCFIALGITSMADPSNPLDFGRLISGILLGILFGFLATSFYRMILWLMNPKLNKTLGKNAIKTSVSSGMLFLIPFTVMALLAAFVLRWSVNGAFVSAGLMSVSIVACNELEKFTGKAKWRNTIAATVLSGGFATLWLLGITKIKFLPTYINGGFDLLRSLIENRM